jgi:hypothetical protein
VSTFNTDPQSESINKRRGVQNQHTHSHTTQHNGREEDEEASFPAISHPASALPSIALCCSLARACLLGAILLVCFVLLRSSCVVVCRVCLLATECLSATTIVHLSCECIALWPLGFFWYVLGLTFLCLQRSCCCSMVSLSLSLSQSEIYSSHGVPRICSLLICCWWCLLAVVVA